jgi:acetyl-CoA acyltransferase 1
VGLLHTHLEALLTKTRSQISDGAAATILARRSWAEERGLKPIGRFLGTQVAGCAPDEMGISPVFTIPALFKYTGIELKDVDFFELNEAFASQALYCIQKLGLDLEKVNPNGGAIAIGHPTGATGARQTATLFNELQSQDKEVGVISMCARYVTSPFHQLHDFEGHVLIVTTALDLA